MSVTEISHSRTCCLLLSSGSSNPPPSPSLQFLQRPSANHLLLLAFSSACLQHEFYALSSHVSSSLFCYSSFFCSRSPVHETHRLACRTTLAYPTPEPPTPSPSDCRREGQGSHERSTHATSHQHRGMSDGLLGLLRYLFWWPLAGQQGCEQLSPTNLLQATSLQRDEPSLRDEALQHRPRTTFPTAQPPRRPESPPPPPKKKGRAQCSGRECHLPYHQSTPLVGTPRHLQHLRPPASLRHAKEPNSRARPRRREALAFKALSPVPSTSSHSFTQKRANITSAFPASQALVYADQCDRARAAAEASQWYADSLGQILCGHG